MQTLNSSCLVFTCLVSAVESSSLGTRYGFPDDAGESYVPPVDIWCERILITSFYQFHWLSFADENHYAQG